MKNFAHVNARSLDEAIAALQRYGKRAAVIAGGTDLLGKMKDEILPTYPEALVNIKTIPGLDRIEEKDGTLFIGALARLEDIATDTRIHRYIPCPGGGCAQDRFHPLERDGHDRRQHLSGYQMLVLP